MAKLAEDLTKNNENQVKRGVWGGVDPPARTAENMPKLSEEGQKIIQKSSKSSPGPLTKSMLKRS